MKENCWEFMECGRAPGGRHVAGLGVCPAATASSADGTHGGRNGGRCCWRIAGTLCGGTVQGSFATKVLTCADCDFFLHVATQEGPDFAP